MDVVDDTCPKCGALLPHEAVVCVSCGYDLKSNVVHRSELPPPPLDTGDDADDADGGEGNDEFVQPGRGSAKVVAIIGGVLTLAAIIITAVVANQRGGSIGFVVTKSAVVLYETLLNTCTGVVAVYATARFCEKKFGPVELAAGRMLTAFALFEVVLHIPIAVPYVGALLELIAAMAAYFLAVWILFARSRYETGLIAAIHFVLWLLVAVGMTLSQSLGAMPQPSRPSSPAPAAASAMADPGVERA